jgi:integrase
MSMPKAKLDAAFCAAAACEAGKRKTDYWMSGGDPAGLVLEVRPSGGKTFYLRYQDHAGRQRQVKLAGYGQVTFEQVRKLAKRVRSEVLLGGDPLAAKREKKAVPTYAALAQQHIAHAKTYQRSWSTTEGIIRKHLLPALGRMRLDEITPQQISRLLAEKLDEGLAPATVEKIRVVLGKSYAFAQEWQIPGVDRNPVRLVKRPVFDNRRTRSLSAVEVERLLEAAARSANPQLKPIVHLLLLTGARLSELLHAKWEHIDLQHRRWLIPMSKTGKARHVPLAQAAIDVIEALPRFEGSPYLLPNLETGKPFISIKRAWQTARRQARLEDCRLHDCRHAAASAMASAGVDIYTIGKLLGHASFASTQRYAHVANETLTRAVEAGAAHLKGAA